MKKITSFYIILVSLFFSNTIYSQGVVINEILASNTTINQDEDGTYQDWVELYNNGTSVIDLSGYGLSDDATLLYKWVFPSISINPGQHLLIWCSDKNRTNPANPLHTNFKLSASGNPVSLTNRTGIIVDSVPATALLQNISYGRLPDGNGNFVFFQNVTPNATNSSMGYNEALSPPLFSAESGFSTTSFNLTLSTSVPGATILYTLDGSEPSESNLGGTTYTYKNQYPELPNQAFGPLLTNTFQTKLYTSPIPIADKSSQPNKLASMSSTYAYKPDYIPNFKIYKGTVVRAKVIKPGALSSKITTKNYFISPLGRNRFSLPILSLSLNENELFDYNSGILVAGIDFDTWRNANPNKIINFDEDANYRRVGVATEKVANMSYFVYGNPILNQDIGIRIHGGTTRAFQSKAFALSTNSNYGNNSIDYKFFSDVSDVSFKSLTLRNSGGDFVNTMFRDALNNRLIKSLNVQTQSYQPTITFVNGEYWGILNLREVYDDKYFTRVFNIASKELDYLENNASVKVGDNQDYINMINYIQNNGLVSDANYNYIKTRLDPESFSDYFIANIFFQNADWPGTNVDYWRKKTSSYIPNAPFGNDGRWRWAIHDMDDTYSFGTLNFSHNNLADATLANGPIYPNPDWSTFLLRKLLENNSFKTAFINRFADLMNTYFLPSRIIAVMNEMKAVIAPEIDEHISRWKAPANSTEWNNFINYEQDFVNARPVFQRNHIRSQFGITSNINATLNVSNGSHGYIKMNTIDVKTGTPGIQSNPYPWTGIYFSNIPVTLKAIANPGFVFSHWTGASASTNPEISINSASDFSVTAVFVPETIASSHPIYYWMMNSAIANNLPLETLTSTYKATNNDGVIQYQSCLVGYPFMVTDLVNWRKASMERRNSPTDINYIPEMNNNLSFALSDMKGLQIKEPLQRNGLENEMVFSFSTLGYNSIKFSFAAINELTNATAIVIDYSINSGAPIWTTSGLISSSFPLTVAYQLFAIDFTSISTVNNNPNFKVRIRFTGTNMTADTGARITFNNIAVFGTLLPLTVNENSEMVFSVSPNPFSDVITVSGIYPLETITYKLFDIDGKWIKTGFIENAQINLNALTSGMYLLQLSSRGKTETKKIIRK
jgi:hypothetical protein